MKPEKTVVMKLTKAELDELRRRRAVCGHCGGVFIPDDDSHKVCEPCVKEAMEAESFPYNLENNHAKD